MAAPLSVKMKPSCLCFPASPGENLLTAATAGGIAVPAACRNGVCEICEARLLAGSAVNTRNQQTLSAGERLMLCRSYALTDLELEMNAIMAAGSNTPRTYQAKVAGVRPLNHDVYQVQLRLPRRRELAFHAGQYLSLTLPEAGPSYFSIASAPADTEIELHIQASPEWGSAQRVVDALASGCEVTLEAPHGQACLAAAPAKPLVLVAAGTGFAQMKSLVDYLRGTGYQQPVLLFWGVRRDRDMYLRSLAEQWQQQWPPLTFVPVVGDEEDNDWAGHHDQLVRAALASQVDWRQVRVIASGSPAMVYTLLDTLTRAGLPEAEFLSDVLEYAPRPS